MRIGIDIDGVTLDLHSAFLKKYEEWYGVEVGEFEHWDDMIDLTGFRTYDEVWDWCDRAGVFHGLPWIPGAPGAIDYLLDQRHSVVFLTAREGAAAEAAQIWHYGSPWLGRTQLVTHLGKSKHTVRCSVYVDDSPHEIAALQADGRKVIKFNRPWNRDVDCEMAADTWEDVITWTETIS